MRHDRGASRAFPLPVVAAVRGRCLGGGFELAQAADLIVAGEGASFGQPEILLGVTAPAACVLLPRRCGYGAAAEILFTGDAIARGPRERSWDSCTRSSPTTRWTSEALALARAIARHSARGAARDQAHAARDGGDAARRRRCAWPARAYVDDVMRTDDALEGLKAFLEKRPAAWRHR